MLFGRRNQNDLMQIKNLPYVIFLSYAYYIAMLAKMSALNKLRNCKLEQYVHVVKRMLPNNASLMAWLVKVFVSMICNYLYFRDNNSKRIPWII